MIGLPIERIFKKKEGDLVADDTELKAGLSDELSRVLGGKLLFGDAPFTQRTDWRLICDVAPFNIAVWEASQHLEALHDQGARATAMRAPASFMMRHIRNALSHGGIVYLDRNGRLVDTQAEMLALVSAQKRAEKSNA